MSILVTGARGNVGRRLVALLAADGHRVRALTRDPASARFPDGVEAVVGDLTDTASVEAALDGVTAAHFITTHGPSYETLPNGPELAALAVKAGVRRATTLWNGFHGPVEEAIEASGLEWTHLRPGEFMSNTLTWADEIRSESVVREPFATIGQAPVHEADIAAVAAVALTEDGHAGRAYTLSGREVLTVGDQVAAIAKAIGRELRYEELSVEQAKERMLAMGIGAESADFVLGWRADPPAAAREASDIVERITGRPARTFAEWAAANADRFR